MVRKFIKRKAFNMNFHSFNCSLHGFKINMLQPNKMDSTNKNEQWMTISGFSVPQIYFEHFLLLFVFLMLVHVAENTLALMPFFFFFGCI